MQFSIGVEYALHSLFYILDLPTGKVVGIKDLALLHQVSETYLSKVFTKLRKQGVVRSIPGVNGGYELAKSPELITFWDVVEAVEGSSYLFQCAELRQKNKLVEASESTDQKPSDPCLIKVVMWEAEDQMRNYLKNKNLRWLQQEVYKDFSKERISKIEKWAQDPSQTEAL